MYVCGGGGELVKKWISRNRQWIVLIVRLYSLKDFIRLLVNI